MLEIGITVNIDACPTELRKHLELIMKDKILVTVMDGVMQHIERKRGVQLKIMAHDCHE